MAKACSIAGVPDDVVAVYRTKDTARKKLSYVKKQLDGNTPNTAQWKHDQLVAQINEQFPGYVDMEDERQGDLFVSEEEADAAAAGKEQAKAKAKAAAQAQKLVREPVTVASSKHNRETNEHTVTFSDGKTTNIYRDTEQFGTAYWYEVTPKGEDRWLGFTKAEAIDRLLEVTNEEQTESKARSKEPSPAKVLKKGETKSPSAASKGKAKLTAAVAKKSERQQDTNPKAESPKVESKPARKSESQQTKREKQQQARLVKETARRHAEDAAQVVQAAKENLPLPERVADAIRDLEGPSNTQVWKDAASTIFEIALINPKEGLKNKGKPNESNQKDAEAYDTALEMVQGIGPHSELLWSDNNTMPSKKILLGWVEDTILTKTSRKVSDPNFLSHIRLWQATIEQGMFQAALRSVTHPQQNVTPVFPRLTDSVSYLREHMPNSYDWTKHGGENVQAEITPETKPKTAEEIDNRKEEYTSLGNEGVEEMESNFYEEDLFDAGVSEADVSSANNDRFFDDDGHAKIFDHQTGKPITKPISMGAAKLLVKRFMARLYDKSIKARVYKNVAEFKRKAPELYAQATASRSDKKPIPNNAAGYAFKKDGKAHVLIFADNIATKDQLNFTIAHEVIGHFGLGSIMPTENFNKLLDDVYANDGNIRKEADLMMEMRGLGKREATEEALADAAAHMDNSLVARIADAIKRFFHALGVKFDDDMTRYFLRHSRIYQRTGRTPDSSPYAVMREFKQMDNLAGRARATQFDHNNEPIRNTEGSSYQNMPGRVKRFLRDISGKDKAALGKTAASRLKNAGKTMGKLLENIQSFDNLALRSRPLRELFKIMTMQKQRLESLKSDLSDIMAWSNKSRYLEDKMRAVGIGRDIKEENRAPTDEERRQAAIASVWRNRMKADAVTEAKLSGAADLGVMVNGEMKIDYEGGFKSNRKAAEMSREELNKGFRVQRIDNNGNPAYEQKDGKDVYYDDSGKVTTETKKDAKGNKVPVGRRKKDMRHEPLVDHEGKPYKISKRVFRLMEQQRLATDTIAAHVYVDKVNGMMEEHKAYFQQLQDEQNLAATETEVLKEVYKVYTKLYNEGAVVEGSGMKWNSASIARAKAFSYNITRLLDAGLSKEKIKDWEQHRDNDTIGMFHPPGSGTHKVKGQKKPVDNGEYHDLTKDVVAKMLAVAKVKDHTGKRKTTASKIHVAIQNMYLMDTQVTNAELYAKNTIQSAYVPLRRDGKYQVQMSGFIRSVDAQGNEVLTPVELPEAIQQQMFYTRMDSPNEAEAKTNELHEILKDQPAVEMHLPGDPADSPSKVVFRATWSTAEQGASLSGSISYDDVANVLVRAGVNLNPADRERLVQLTASEHSTARNNLRKNWSPGYDPNIQHRVAEHLEQQAHISAKNRHVHKVSRLMINERGNWKGDEGRLNELQREFLRTKKLGNEAATDIAYQKMAAFQWQHISSAPTMGGGEKNIKMMARDGEVKMVAGHNKGEQYHDKAKAIIEGYHKHQGTPVTGDEAFANQGSWAMSGTALFHLGGSLAPALVNMTAIITHSANYLATMNSKTGYGGGHGYNAAFIALTKAGKDMSLFRDGLTDMTGSAKNIQKLIDNGTWKKYFESVEEAEFMRDLTREGATTPNLFNSLSDVAASGHADSAVTKVAEKWMIMFAKSEQYNRRVTALASYRLDKQRLLASKPAGYKMTNVDKLTLHDRATDAVNFSQGNYDSFNRPSWAQGNVFKYLWMYKQFQVITVQLMRNVSHADRLKMVGMLILLSGLKGVPFMDDIWDLFDTLMQKFGLKWAGVEAEMTMLLKDTPISSALVARGVLDHSFGFTGSTRFSMGDLIPGTGMLKAGADLGRETESIFGPVYGAWKGALVSGATLAQYVAESVGLKDDVTSLSDVLKTGAGFSALKNYARGITMMMDGTITNNRGQIVAKDAGILDALTQLVGFYPAAATDQYAVIRMTNDARNYAQAIKSAYVDAAIKADSAKERNAINQMVREWNKDSKGTPFYIKNFPGAVSTARKAARMNSVGRNLKSVPTAMKKFGKGLAESRGLDAKGIPLE